MIQYLACLMLFPFVLLFCACTGKQPGALPGEVMVNASDLPNGIVDQEFHSLNVKRSLIINLDKPELPWSIVARGLMKAHACGVTHIHLRRGNDFAPVFSHGIEQNLPVIADTKSALEIELGDDIVMDVPDAIADSILDLEDASRKGSSQLLQTTEFQEISGPVRKSIPSSCPEREACQMVYWRIKGQSSPAARKDDLHAFTKTAWTGIHRRQAFTFIIDDDVPAGEVFDYLHVINAPSMLVGVTFNQPGISSEKSS